MLGPNSGETRKKTRVDFQARKSEAGWQEALDRFWRRATPLWFEWLEWVLILGVISFVAEKTQSLLLLILRRLSYVALFFYLNAVFYQFEFHGFPFVTSDKLRRTLSLPLSGIVAFGVYLILSRMVGQLEGRV